MFRIFNCLTTQHDWRLVVVAGVVCFLSSLTAITLFNRARSTANWARAIWIAADRRRRRLRHMGDAFPGHAGLRPGGAGRL